MITWSKSFMSDMQGSAIAMSLRHGGRQIDPTRPDASLLAAGCTSVTGKLVILVHGLWMNDLQWQRHGHDHGAALADELGYTALYLRYNSRLSVEKNGRSLSALLDTLAKSWPRPVEQITVLGHSMGGLVARSACSYGEQQGGDWLHCLRNLVFLGTPHHGSSFERVGQWVDNLVNLSPYSAPLARFGEACGHGIQDLPHRMTGTGGLEFVTLPAGVECFAAAAMLGSEPNSLAERLVGDGLVPVDSALGRHRDPRRTLNLPQGHQWIGRKMGHLDLLSRPEVYAQLKRWIGGPQQR